MAEKVDLKRTRDGYRAERDEFRIVDVPEERYLMIDGRGDPNTSPRYAEALAALYPAAYAVKFASKRGLGRDYVVPPLEGLWWADDMAWFTSARDKSRWNWTMMLLVPEWVSGGMVMDAVAQVREKKAPPRLDEIRLESLREGRCVQTLHVGSFDDEAAVLERMHTDFIPANGLRLSGTHHEVYLSDARRVAPERMRTILRQPVVEDH